MKNVIDKNRVDSKFEKFVRDADKAKRCATDWTRFDRKVKTITVDGREAVLLG